MYLPKAAISQKNAGIAFYVTQGCTDEDKNFPEKNCSFDNESWYRFIASWTGLYFSMDITDFCVSCVF